MVQPNSETIDDDACDCGCGGVGEVGRQAELCRTESGKHDQQRQQRQRQKGIRQSHQHRVEQTAEVAGEEPGPSVPSAADASAAHKPTVSEARPPISRRTKTSRPSSSVPRRWVAVGGAKRSNEFTAFGSMPSSVATPGAAAAADASAISNTNPATAVGWRRNRNQARRQGVVPLTAIPGRGDPRIEQGQRDVGQQVAGERERRCQQQCRECQVEIVAENGIVDEPPHPRDRRRRFRSPVCENRVYEFHTDDRGQGDQRSTPGMAENNLPLAQPLGARGADPLLTFSVSIIETRA